MRALQRRVEMCENKAIARPSGPQCIGGRAFGPRCQLASVLSSRAFSFIFWKRADPASLLPRRFYGSPEFGCYLEA